MKLPSVPNAGRSARRHGFTLVEVAFSMAIAAVAIGGVVYGYVMSAQRAEWSAYSLAAQSLAMQRLEQTRASKWDPTANPSVDQLVESNFPVVVDILDIPVSGTNVVYATNRTTITTVSTTPPLKMIRVECSWSFQDRRVHTNQLMTYRAPDQ